jgi:hypothetical protein
LFVAAAADGEAARVALAQHEFDVVSVCAAADRALQEGRPVDIEYP